MRAAPIREKVLEILLRAVGWAETRTQHGAGRMSETGAKNRRDLARGWVLLGLAEIAVWLVLRHGWALDLTALYYAAHFWHTGQTELIYLPGPSVFVGSPPPEYLSLFTAETGLPAQDARLTPYLYPPLWAAVFAPLAAKVSAITFFDIFQIANLAALAGTIWLAFRFTQVPGFGFLPWAALSLGLFGFTAAGAVGLWFGQPQILVSFFVMFAAWALAERYDIGAGAALGLAAAIKLSPALFVVFFLMERRWRALGSFIVVGAGLGGLSVAVAGWPLHVEMLQKLAAINAHVLISRIVISLELWLVQLSGAGLPGWSFPTPVMVAEPGWVTLVVRATLIGGLVVSWAATRGLPDRPRLWARFLAVLLVTLITSPLGWVHYFALPLLLLPGFAHFLAPAALMRLVVVVGGLMSMPLLFLLARHDNLAFVQAGINLAVTLGLLALLLALAHRAQRADRAH